MAYRIVYGPEPDISCQRVPHGGRRALLTGCFFMLFLFLLRNFWPEGREALRELVIPGDPEVTAEALRAMVSTWETGGDFGTAFTVFCREIIRHGTVY